MPKNFNETNVRALVATPNIPDEVLFYVKKGQQNYQPGGKMHSLLAQRTVHAKSGGRKDNAWLKNTLDQTEAEIIEHFHAINLPPPPVFTLEEIRHETFINQKKSSEIPRFNIVEGVSANYLHEAPSGKNAVFQLASQADFNEAPNSSDTPVTDWVFDPTQGPQGSIEAAAAALHRKAAKKNDRLPHALTLLLSDDFLKTNKFPPLESFYKNGYLLLGKLNPEQKACLLTHIEQNIDKLLILPQWAQCEVSGAMQLQVFSWAPSFQGMTQPTLNSVEDKICTILVVAQYRAAAQLAVLRARETGQPVPLHLTLVGQGAFNNRSEVMREAMKAVAEVIKGENVEVFVHVYDKTQLSAQNYLETMEFLKNEKILSCHSMTKHDFFQHPHPADPIQAKKQQPPISSSSSSSSSSSFAIPKHAPMSDIPLQSGTSFALFSMAKKSAIEYSLQNFRKKPGIACSATLIWSGEAGKNVPVTLYEDFNRRIGKIGYVINPNEVEVPHAEFFAMNTGGQVKEEVKKDGCVIKNYDEDWGTTTTQTYESKYKEKGGHKKSMGRQYFNYITNHAKWDSMEKKWHDEGSVDIFAKNVWKRYWGEPKKSSNSLKEDKRYGGQGEMEYNEALVWQKGNVNPIDGLVIDITTPVLDSDVNDVLSILKRNPHLKLYLYNRKLQSHIVRFCANAHGINILNKGAEYLNSKKELEGLTPLSANTRSKQAIPVGKTLADKAREFIADKGFLDEFKIASIQDKKDSLLYSWGASIKSPEVIQNYDELKIAFVRNNISEDNHKYKCMQIFNDIVREQMIEEISRTDLAFAAKYNESFVEMHLDCFLTKEEYDEAKSKMIELIEKETLNIAPLIFSQPSSSSSCSVKQSSSVHQESQSTETDVSLNKNAF